MVKLNEGDRFRIKDKPEHWKLEGGKKRVYTTAEAFLEDGGKWDKAKIVTADQAGSIPDGNPIVSRYELVLEKLGRKKIERIFVDGDPITPKQLLLNERQQIDSWIITERDAEKKITAAENAEAKAKAELAKANKALDTIKKENTVLDTQVEVQTKAIADRDALIVSQKAEIETLKNQEQPDCSEYQQIFGPIYFKVKKGAK